jgi:hypothetical protein
MTLQVSTLRPGLLIALSTSVNGNVSYAKKTIDADHYVNELTRRARWETERTIQDAKEHEAAIKTRSKIRSLITGVCARSDYGLLCPEDKAEELADKIAEARKLADDFNAGAVLTKVEVYILPARIAPDEVEAARAIRAELRGLVEDMQRAIRAGDPKAIREAANKARSISQMLSDDKRDEISAAITIARGVARRLSKQADVTTVEIDQQAIEALGAKRALFLDLDVGGDVTAPVAEEGLDLDIGDAPEARSAANGYQPEAPEIEIDDPIDINPEDPSIRAFIDAGIAERDRVLRLADDPAR